MSYFAILTTLGQSKIANAIATETPINLTEMAWGDGGGNPITPTPSMTALVNEVYRAGINEQKQDPLNPPQVQIVGIIPTAIGGFWLREAGIFDEDGDMIAVCNMGDTYKESLAEGAVRDFLTRFILNVGNTAAINLLIDPAIVLASRQWTTDNFQTIIVGGSPGDILIKGAADGDVSFIPQSTFFKVANLFSEITTANNRKTARENLGILDMNGATSKQINSVSADAFAVKDVLRHDGTNWVKAQANTDAGSEARAVVVEKINSTTYIVVTHGFADLTGLTANTQYYLSEATAGLLTNTPPTTGIKKPILITNETGKAVINISAFGKRA